MANFEKDLSKLQGLLLKIPEGKVTTYSALARALGKPKACRYVGNLLNSNSDLEKYPCYKVVRSNREVGGYILGEKEKIRKLGKDGVLIEDGKVRNFRIFCLKVFNKL